MQRAAARDVDGLELALLAHADGNASGGEGHILCLDIRRDGGGELAHRVGVERKTVEIAVAHLIAACAAVQNGLVAEVNERRGIDELLARGVDTVAVRVADLAAGEVDGEGVFLDAAVALTVDAAAVILERAVQHDRAAVGGKSNVGGQIVRGQLAPGTQQTERVVRQRGSVVIAARMDGGEHIIGDLRRERVGEVRGGLHAKISGVFRREAYVHQLTALGGEIHADRGKRCGVRDLVRGEKTQQCARVVSLGGEGVALFLPVNGFRHRERAAEPGGLIHELGVIWECAADSVGLAVFKVDRAVCVVERRAVAVDAGDGSAVLLRAGDGGIRAQADFAIGGVDRDVHGHRVLFDTRLDKAVGFEVLLKVGVEEERRSRAEQD